MALPFLCAFLSVIVESTAHLGLKISRWNLFYSLSCQRLLELRQSYSIVQLKIPFKAHQSALPCWPRIATACPAKTPPRKGGVFVSLTLPVNRVKIIKKVAAIQPTGPVISSRKSLFPPKSSFLSSALKGSVSMVDHDLNNLKRGALLKVIGGLRLWEYRGMQNGKIIFQLRPYLF